MGCAGMAFVGWAFAGWAFAGTGLAGTGLAGWALGVADFRGGIGHVNANTGLDGRQYVTTAPER